MPSVPASTEGPGPPFYLTWILGLAALISVLFGLVAVFAPVPAATLPLGLFVLFFAPGYALGSLLFPRGTRLQWPASFAIVVGLSVVFNAVIGLILLVYSLGLPPVIFAIAAVTLDLVALLVRRIASPTPRSTNGEPTRLPAALSLPHYTRGQRSIAYVLFGAIVVVVAITIYLGTVPVSSNGQVSLGLTGLGPHPNAVTNVPLPVNIAVGNNATVQTFELEVSSLNNSSAPSTVVPWASPLILGVHAASFLNFSLNARASTTFSMELQFPLAHTYVVSILLKSSSTGATLRETYFSIEVV